MSKPSSVGEWIRGPFASATIEGVIVEEENGNYDFIVSDIAGGDTLPPALQVGSKYTLPTHVVDDFFIKMNVEQQNSLIMIAQHIGEYDWARELTDNFNKIGDVWSC